MAIKPIRDSQKTKVANAVLAFRDGRDIPAFDTDEQLQAYTDKLIRSAWFGRRWNIDSIDVKQSRTRTYGACDARQGQPNTECAVEVAATRSDELALLEQIAHCCVANTTEAPYAVHGWQYASTLAELIGRQFGKDARKALIEQFKAHRVRYRKPRQLSEEQKQALRDRMAALRAQKKAA